jgi:hypothetical protein
LTAQQPAVITPELHLFHTERLQVRPLQDLDLDA